MLDNVNLAYVLLVFPLLLLLPEFLLLFFLPIITAEDDFLVVGVIIISVIVDSLPVSSSWSRPAVMSGTRHPHGSRATAWLAM